MAFSQYRNFKDQGIVPPEKHLEIGKWFGKIESTFYNHPKSPHRDIFRVSNDRTEGKSLCGFAVFNHAVRY